MPSIPCVISLRDWLQLEAGPWWAVAPCCWSAIGSPTLAPCLAREMGLGTALNSCSSSWNPLAGVPRTFGKSLPILRTELRETSASFSGCHCAGVRSGVASSCWLPDWARKPHRTEDRVQNPEFSPEACPFSGHPVFEPIHFLYVKASLSWKPKHPNDSLNPHFIFSNPLVSPRERGSNCKARQSNTIKLNWRSVGVDWHPLCSQQELAIVS